jgi:hypothetical protein
MITEIFTNNNQEYHIPSELPASILSELDPELIQNTDSEEKSDSDVLEVVSKNFQGKQLIID